MQKSNQDIRKYIHENGLTFYWVAYEIGITGDNFSKWLRLPMSDNRKNRTIEATKELIRKQHEAEQVK